MDAIMLWTDCKLDQFVKELPVYTRGAMLSSTCMALLFDRTHTPLLIHTLFDFVYTWPVLNPADQWAIWLNGLQTGQKFEIWL